MPPEMSRQTDKKKSIKKGIVRQNFKTISEGYVKTITDESGDLKPVKELSSELERTLIIIKPDGVQRGLIGKIIQRFQNKNFIIVAMKMILASSHKLQKHYSEVSDHPFFTKLLKYMSSGPIVLIVFEGLNAIRVCRQMIGKSNPADCLPGTIRGDFGIYSGRNLIHGSNSLLSALRETAIWFNDNELIITSN